MIQFHLWSQVTFFPPSSPANTSPWLWLRWMQQVRGVRLGALGSSLVMMTLSTRYQHCSPPALHSRKLSTNNTLHALHCILLQSNIKICLFCMTNLIEDGGLNDPRSQLWNAVSTADLPTVHCRNNNVYCRFYHCVLQTAPVFCLNSVKLHVFSSLKY